VRRIEQEAACELVAAQAGGERDRGHGSGDFARDGTQQRIAHGMAVHVVDRLEMVEVDDHQRHCLAPVVRAHEHRGAFLVQAAAVEESGQRIATGQYVRTLFGGGTDADFVAQCGVAAPAEQDQRDIEQQRDHQRAVRGGAALEIMLQGLGQYGAAGTDEHQDRGDADRPGDQVGAWRRPLEFVVLVEIQLHAGKSPTPVNRGIFHVEGVDGVKARGGCTYLRFRLSAPLTVPRNATYVAQGHAGRRGFVRRRFMRFGPGM
jgi:hypothetical protein